MSHIHGRSEPIPGGKPPNHGGGKPRFRNAAGIQRLEFLGSGSPDDQRLDHHRVDGVITRDSGDLIPAAVAAGPPDAILCIPTFFAPQGGVRISPTGWPGRVTSVALCGRPLPRHSLGARATWTASPSKDTGVPALIMREDVRSWRLPSK